MTSVQPALFELPLGDVRPAGWLLDQLRLQAAGQTGRLHEIWSDVGPDSAWLGGTGEDWERGPYLHDGLLPLAYVLDDAALQATSRQWIEAVIDGQRADGQFGPATNDDWWPRMVALKVLTQHADATGDPRIAPFLERYFRYQAQHLPQRPLEDWGRARGADNILSVLWLHERVGGDWLIELARLLLAQTTDWHTFLTRDLCPEPTRVFSHLTHGPNIAMGLKTPAAAYLMDGEEIHRGELPAMLDNLDRQHGLVHGVFSGDEWLGGRDPHHGVETCQVVELMFTLEQSARIFGDARYGDLLEQVAYNLLAAGNDPRMLAHQYHQQANQVLVDVAQRDWTFSGDDANVFGLEPHFGCCTANLHQGWPKLARSLWMRTGDGGLAAVAYAACTVDTGLGGTSVRLDVDTAYPFEEEIRITVGVGAPATFPLRLRIPQWCTDAQLFVAGEEHPAEADSRGYHTIRRTWQPGDLVTLRLPMRLRTVPRDRGAVGLRLGPLVMAFAVGENWWPVPGAPGLAEWHITPRTWWNIGLWLDDPRGVDGWRIERRPVSAVPFTAADAPVVVHAKGAPLPQWRLDGGSAGPLPQSPVTTLLPMHDVRLLPYGCTRLRVAELPVVVPGSGTT